MKMILLCLHGWGGSKESFTELRKALEGTDSEILTPDLPGFGTEPEPTTVWGIDEYTEWVEEWLHKTYNLQPTLRPPVQGLRTPQGLERRAHGREATYNLLLLGHSFGGQIAVKLALRGNLPIRHLFLCAPAAIRPCFSLKRTVGYVIAKCGKTLLALPGLHLLQPIFRAVLYRLMGVHDYERASPLMQKTMLRVTHQDLTQELHRLSLPVDLFWGLDDRITPLWKGQRMNKLIPGSSIHAFPNTRHGVHRDRAQEIAAIITARINRK
ncbi:hypothetical protein A3H22_01885 [Candidatus Peribacteria bacterium RIFCSPLOWO2_12_FULL_55_15]|nr:MAG: hypothetical protein A2789_03205 [Candidatus Peribacteria bacterium RIFCSPHIGHO2_01_FULL_54_22]OGJ63389.1 MAG: hypothetical protein A3D12_04035 [Candidatus Peribacteria bacterium RIFCSPHIGHO2_02_FULL_55_24]OGJ63977.1 MAG: hypothetical protein A3E47_02590 [Candidatus Peribacteria bacterium RIFCSPHIGHO2_12_FULL_54_10]OGJ67897.1 MAG: hypothetical protein A2947_03600 [Candidatus Peribacteria bacterium RIFCSPLOWO2_01_FULL_54_110]OGJ70442.1 MAG: hypothetical protein A3H90_04120 [Candidatus Pe